MQSYISIYQLHQYLDVDGSDCLVIDIRSEKGRLDGSIRGALFMSADQVMNQWSDFNNHSLICLLCSKGIQSKKLLDRIVEKYSPDTSLCSVEGGFSAWVSAGFPIYPVNHLADMVRYSRQLILPGFDQKKLLDAKIVLVGVGGLGAPCAMYLTSTGVGEIVLVDFDRIELTNLHRQTIYNETQLKKKKVFSAKKFLNVLNSQVKIRAVDQHIDSKNVVELIENADVVIDGSDNLNTRYLLSDHCYLQGVPLVSAAVYQYEVQVSVFDFRQPDSPCYRCMFPEPDEFNDLSCQQNGVLGVTPGIAGILQATEAIKLITGIAKPLVRGLLCWDLRTHQQKVIKYKRNNNCEHGAGNA